MEDTIKKAQDVLFKAEKKINSFSLFGSNSKYEEALDLYEKSFNYFKMARCWNEVIEVAIKISKINIKLNNKYEAATYYIEASNACHYNDSSFAYDYLNEAIKLFKDNGNFNLVAKYYKQLAELYGTNNRELAIQNYNNAIQFFDLTNENVNANQCKHQMAILYTELTNMSQAAELFEEIAKYYINHNTLKYQVKALLLNAGICKLYILNPSQMYELINSYKDIDITFDGRECNFLINLTKAMENNNVIEFSTIINKYDDMTRLDNWKVQVLLAIKNKIVMAEFDDEEDLI